MWVILGVIAIAVTFLNLFLFAKGKDYRLAMALGLSFTALTLCAEYSMVSDWVAAEDWAALMDVVPTMEWALWFLTIVSILLNITPVILEKRRK